MDIIFVAALLYTYCRDEEWGDSRRKIGHKAIPSTHEKRKRDRTRNRFEYVVTEHRILDKVNFRATWSESFSGGTRPVMSSDSSVVP